jgi:hypothetical protein
MKKMLRIGLLTVLGVTMTDDDGRTPDKPLEVPRFVLGIDGDKSLTLDGKAITREALEKTWPRLAEQIRAKARAAGKTLDAKQGLPAVITFWAVDETPYSLVYALSLETQKSGFQTWSLVRRSLFPNPSLTSHAAESTMRSEPSELPALLRTLPIRLRADRLGNIDSVALGETELQDFKALRFEPSKIQDDPDTPFDQALLRIDSHLTFAELVRVTDLLARYRITHINFMEIRPEEGD